MSNIRDSEAIMLMTRICSTPLECGGITLQWASFSVRLAGRRALVLLMNGN